MASLCLFCCRRIESDNCEEKVVTSSEEILLKFLKVTRSHFGIILPKLPGRSEGPLEAKVCLKCEQSLISICKLYRELECIRLKMEWEFGELIGKMGAGGVGRTPSFMNWLRRNQLVDKFQNMVIFRNSFIFNCNQSLERSKPILALQRIKELTPNISIPDNFSDHFDDTTWTHLDDVDGDTNDVDDDEIEDQTEKKYSPELENSSPPISPVVNFNDSDNHSDYEPSTRVKPPIKKPFKCSQCPTAYTQRNNLLRHLRSHHPHYFEHLYPKIEKPFKCHHCPVSCSHQTSLRRHQRIFHPQLYQSQRTKLLQSNTDTSEGIDETCRSFLDNVDIDTDDVNQVNPDVQTEKKYSPALENPPPSISPVVNVNDLDNHSDDEASTIVKPPVKKAFKCSECPSAFTQRNNLLHHQRTHHLSLYFEQLYRQKEKPFKCTHCPVRCSHKNSLRRHQRIFHGQLHQSQRKKIQSTAIATTKPIQKISKTPKSRAKTLKIPCPICQRPIGNNTFLLKSHFDLHHSPKDSDPVNVHKCDHANCPDYFRTLFQLTRHKRVVHGEKDDILRTTCPICSRICTEHANLKFHMKTQHNDESPDLPLACDVPGCPKRFPNEAVLKWHQMYYFHVKRERPVEIIKCPDCHQEIRGLGAFKKHQKTHLRPEEPFVCELCGAAFRKKVTLELHGLFHKGPDNWAFQCETCGKKCATKYRLRDHMQVHSDVKKYSCQCCGRGFNCRQHLRKHVNKFHAQEGFRDIPRKMKKPKFISRRIPSPSPIQK